MSHEKKVIFNALCKVAKIGRFQHVWLNDDVVLHILNVHCTSIIPSNVALTTNKLNATLRVTNYSFTQQMNSPNYAGIFMQGYRPKNNKRIVGYYFTSNNTSIPPSNQCWYHNIVTDVDQIVMHPPQTRSKTRQYNRQHNDSSLTPNPCPLSRARISPSFPVEEYIHTTDQFNVHINPSSTCTNSRPLNIDTIITSDDGTNINSSNSRREQTTVVEYHTLQAELLRNHTKWDSPECLQLFVPTTTTAELSEKNISQSIFIKSRLRRSLSLFRNGWLTPMGWREVVDGDETTKDKCTPFEIFSIQKRCKYLALTIHSTLKSYHQLSFHVITTNSKKQIETLEFSDETEDDDE